MIKIDYTNIKTCYDVKQIGMLIPSCIVDNHLQENCLTCRYRNTAYHYVRIQKGKKSKGELYDKYALGETNEY